MSLHEDPAVLSQTSSLDILKGLSKNQKSNDLVFDLIIGEWEDIKEKWVKWNKNLKTLEIDIVYIHFSFRFGGFIGFSSTMNTILGNKNTNLDLNKVIKDY